MNELRFVALPVALITPAGAKWLTVDEYGLGWYWTVKPKYDLLDGTWALTHGAKFPAGFFAVPTVRIWELDAEKDSWKEIGIWEAPESKDCETDLPVCLGYRDYEGDFGCEYDVPWECESCLCNHEIGGHMDPRTPEKYDDDSEGD